MTRRTKTPRHVGAHPAQQDVRPAKRSWTALVAASTLGLAGASMLHADVRSDARLDESRIYRLVVQTYDQADARPLASAQREVTAAELRQGVRVGLLELRQGSRVTDASDDRAQAVPVVVAWVEEGMANLELDGLRARPQAGSLRGVASRTRASDAVVISMTEPDIAA